MFIDYNLYGMNMLNVAAVKFRRKAQDGESLPIVIVWGFKEWDNHRLRGRNSCLNLLMSLQLYSDCGLDSVVFGHYSLITLHFTWYVLLYRECKSPGWQEQASLRPDHPHFSWWITPGLAQQCFSVTAHPPLECGHHHKVTNHSLSSGQKITSTLRCSSLFVKS